jgi:hypothetical protein
MIGLGAGVVLGFLSWPLWTRFLRGRSTSRYEIRFAKHCAPMMLPFILVAPLVIFNAACDRSPERAEDLEAVSISFDDSEGKLNVDALGPEPVGEQRYDFVDRHRVGKTPATVRLWWRRGALGFAWQSRPVELRGDGYVLVEE